MTMFGRLFNRDSQPTYSPPVKMVPADDRLMRDRQVARTCLPANTQEKVVDGRTLWLYSFLDRFDRQYTMATYFDGRQYQVRVLVPDVPAEAARYNRKLSIHDCHFFPASGKICLRPPADGETSLSAAYSKSVIWATGFTIYCETGKFPFSKNNE